MGQSQMQQQQHLGMNHNYGQNNQQRGQQNYNKKTNMHQQQQYDQMNEPEGISNAI